MSRGRRSTWRARVRPARPRPRAAASGLLSGPPHAAARGRSAQPPTGARFGGCRRGGGAREPEAVPPTSPHVPTEQAKWRRRARSRRAGLRRGPKVRQTRAARAGPHPGRRGCPQPGSLRRGACGATAGARLWRRGCRRPRTRTPLSGSPAGAAARSSRGGRRWGRGSGKGRQGEWGERGEEGGDKKREGAGLRRRRGGCGRWRGRRALQGASVAPALWALSPRGGLRWRAAHPARSVPLRARVAAGGSYLCLPFLYRPPSCCGAVAREMPGVTLGRGVLAPSSPRASLPWGTGGSDP